MSYTYSAGIDKGRVRNNNEDAIALDEGLGLVVLADGMGGYQAGEVASGMASILIRDEMALWLKQAATPPRAVDVRQALGRTVSEANLAIFTKGLTLPECRGMGTTVVAAVFMSDMLVLGHVGDSRAYRLREGQLTQLTKDHSVLQEEIDAGLVTPEQALMATHKNLVTRALGVDPGVVMDLIEEGVQPGDLYLLCSDGLTDMVRDSQITQILQMPQTLQNKADQLVDAANELGGRDNISVVLIQAAQKLQPRGLLNRLLGK